MNHDTAVAQSNTWARPSDAQLETFFRDRGNFHSGMRVAGIIYAVGKFDAHDDWDRGRVIYEWRRTTFRVRVTTASDSVTLVEALDPALSGRFDEAGEVLWEHPRFEPGPGA